MKAGVQAPVLPKRKKEKEKKLKEVYSLSSLQKDYTFPSLTMKLAETELQ
jgi:hypothetical protein